MKEGYQVKTVRSREVEHDDVVLDGVELAILVNTEGTTDFEKDKLIELLREEFYGMTVEWSSYTAERLHLRLWIDGTVDESDIEDVINTVTIMYQRVLNEGDEGVNDGMSLPRM
jgi:hypothetical protein